MKERILVVDDEPDLQVLIKQKFRREIRDKEFDFVFAENGRAAIELLLKDPEIYLVLTDINMPEMDGLELLERMNKLNRVIKSVIVSAYGDMDKIRVAMNRGAFDFITKPIEFGDLQRTMEKAVHELAFVRNAMESQALLQRERLDREIAEKREKVKQQFLANMSHEIRTPINAIYGMTKLLQNKPEESLQDKYLDAIDKSCQNLIIIVNDILDLSKLEAEKMDFEKIPFSVRECLETVQTTLHFRAEEKGLVFLTDVDPEVPEYLLGDETRLTQILINLTNNAIKFTEKGEIRIRCSVDKFEKVRDSVSCHLHIEVIDTGIGIPENKIREIFDSFVQASPDISRKYGGTGLGLSISKKFVEAQKGQFYVTSNPGKGSTFSFMIPYQVTSAPKTKPKMVKPSAEQLKTFGALKILLVEDSDFNQMMAVDLLKYASPDIQIRIANNGQEALDQLKDDHFDVVLMDIKMPVMDGLEATRIIKKYESYRSIPIIAMTSAASKAELDECYAVGMDATITKPFDTDGLIINILNLIKKKKS